MPAAAQAVLWRIKPRQACDGRATVTALRESCSTRGSCQTRIDTNEQSWPRRKCLALRTLDERPTWTRRSGGRRPHGAIRYIAAVNAESLELQ
jgi:hypothetical protein